MSSDKPPGTASPEHSAPVGADDQRLVERLCAVTQRVVYFPVRHHSPAAARLLAEFIDARRPAAVLIEGPSDFQPYFAELQLPHELPIAIYSYFRTDDGDRRGAYYPFSEYSPEWQAITHAAGLGIEARFIDLPWAEVADMDRVTHRYADAELRRGRYVRAVCDRLGVEDFDDLWDKIVESDGGLDLADYLRRVHWLCWHTRLWEAEISQADQRREAFMAGQIAAALAEFSGQLLVVTGGFHSSALAARLEGFECPGTAPVESAESPPSFADRGIALTTYSYERLDNLAGYDAGMPSPGFYDHAWQSQSRGEAFSHAPLVRQIVAGLRSRKQTVSTADLIALETSARALAALRGREQVWRRDLVDAATSALVKDELQYGCRSQLLDAVHDVLRGNRRGMLADGTRRPPLVVDIKRQLEQAELELSRGAREVELDLLEPVDRNKSRLLHALAVLQIAGYQRKGGTDFLARQDLTRLWEVWRLGWSPEFEATAIEAARYGVSLDEAVAARLTELAAIDERSAARAAALLVQAAQVGVEAISAPLLARLESLVLEEAEFTAAAEALGHLLFLYCHDEAFGAARLPRIGDLLAQTFARALWLLDSLGQSTQPPKELLQAMHVLLEAYERAADVLADSADEFAVVLERVEGDGFKPAQLRGAALGMLWTLGKAAPESVLDHMRLFTRAEQLGDFLTGLFALAREVAQRHPQLVQSIDHALLELTSEEFQQTLPSMRLAFTYFTPREKHYMLSTLFESLGLQPTQPLAALKVDAQTAAAALVLEEKLFAALAQYGLEESET
ncbi:MAG TPA: DUF5682 family protein [Pirellulales bacterium]|nr:DUF5682 family protein [Pirellulales bacterium]